MLIRTLLFLCHRFPAAAQFRKEGRFSSQDLIISLFLAKLLRFLCKMPLYQQIIMALPKATSESLVQLFKNHSKTVLANGGNIRGIENHGVKPLAERTRRFVYLSLAAFGFFSCFTLFFLHRKYAVQDGSRYFWEARFISTTFDASPKCLVEIDRMLRNENEVLRTVTLKLDTAHDRATTNSYKNPYYFEKP